MHWLRGQRDDQRVSALYNIDRNALRQFVQSPSGPVALDLLRRGRNVETLAKRLCPVRKTGGGGQLRASITHYLATDALGLICLIGSSLAYAVFVHEGSGIYGPQGTPIVPKRAKMLRWLGDDGAPVFAKSSKGTPPRRFLTEALVAARD